MFKLSSRSCGNVKRERSKSWTPCIEQIESRTLLSAVIWTGSGGDNNWDTAANWNTDSIPGPTDDVMINIAADVVHSNNVADSIQSLTSSEPLTISGGTLSIAAASTISSTLSITGGTLTGTGDVTVSGLVTLTSGTLSGASTLDANGGILLNPSVTFGGVFSIDGRTINNGAGQTATWTGNSTNTGSIQASDGSVFNNNGSFVANTLGLYEDTGVGAASVFNNKGSFTTNGPSGNIGFDAQFNSLDGTVEIEDDSQLDLGLGSANAGASFNIEPTGTLDLANYTLDPNTIISGSGNLNVQSMALPGNYAFTGTTYIEHGDTQVDGSLAGSMLSFEDTSDNTLSGDGTVGAITVGGGVVSPGDGTSPGVLNALGDVVFSPHTEEVDEVGSTFSVVLNGQAAGAGYSQLNVTGQVNLAGSDFTPSLGFTPTNGEQFTIIKSTEPILGTFFQLPEGASLTIGNSTFTISYHGGSGDDVVLTQSSSVTPMVTGVSPASGPAAGGTQVTITGIGFTGATGVEFGSTAASSFTVVNDTTITADSPPGEGAVDVSVSVQGVTTATSSNDLFTYTVVAAPSVTGISPSSGPAAGGTLVTIHGSGFTGATTVDFGATAATAFTVVSDTTITADSPAGAGLVDVTVTAAGGVSFATPVDQFTYVRVLAVAPTAALPTVVSLQRFGIHMQPTVLVLSVSSGLDPKSADDVENYTIFGPGSRRIAIRSAVYDPSAQTVTIRPAGRIDLHYTYHFKVDSVVMGGLGYSSTLNWKNVVLTAAEARRYVLPKHGSTFNA